MKKLKIFFVILIIPIIIILGYLYYTIFLAGLDISNNFYKKSIQEKSLSCESSAASDIISTILNKEITEDDIINKLPKSKFNETIDLETDIWGDPNKGFVGYIDKYKGRDASQRRYQGYGVYEAPIAKVYSEYGIENKIINIYSRENYDLKNNKEHITYLLKELENGNHVQLWGDWCTDVDYEDGKYYKKENFTNKLANSGKTKSNFCSNIFEDRTMTWFIEENGELREFKGLNGEHAFILLGYKGKIDNPNKIIVWDTNTGKHIYDIKEWFRKWDLMQNRSLILNKKNIN